MKKILFYLSLLVFTLFLTGCGGGGGSNPAGPQKVNYPENVELKTANPHVATNYGTLKSIMTKPSSTEAEQASLTTKLLTHFSKNFKDDEGNDAWAKIQSSTLSNLKKYKINSYEFKPIVKDGIAHTNSSDTSITVQTLIELNVTTRSSGSTIDIVNKTFNITWGKNESGDWLIISGFPTTSAKLGL